MLTFVVIQGALSRRIATRPGVRLHSFDFRYCGSNVFGLPVQQLLPQ